MGPGRLWDTLYEAQNPVQSAKFFGRGWLRLHTYRPQIQLYSLTEDRKCVTSWVCCSRFYDEMGLRFSEIMPVYMNASNPVIG